MKATIELLLRVAICDATTQASAQLNKRYLTAEGLSRQSSQRLLIPLPDFHSIFQISLSFADAITGIAFALNPYFCSCREAEGEPPVSGDPWANCEFHIKWKRYAYIQCSWDTRATLSQLGGYKRVVNYMKRWDDLQVSSVCLFL